MSCCKSRADKCGLDHFPFMRAPHEFADAGGRLFPATAPAEPIAPWSSVPDDEPGPRRRVDRSSTLDGPPGRTTVADGGAIVRSFGRWLVGCWRRSSVLSGGRRAAGGAVVRPLPRPRRRQRPCQGPPKLISVILDRTGPGAVRTAVFRPGAAARTAKRVTHRTSSSLPDPHPGEPMGPPLLLV